MPDLEWFVRDDLVQIAADRADHERPACRQILLRERRPQHGEASPAVVGQLEVHAGPGAAEPADELGHQPLARAAVHAGHDGEAGVEAEGEGGRPLLDHQARVLHRAPSAPTSGS